ncbi:SMI1/KNR4 family protein [Streptomyces sp. BJ20]|uniref:SMI1/KNR4 family protein n=1 Tax=Streptomyces sp. BJ20 TaxID=2930049 RepID=UPI001FD40334|nr:SMI1/KNR4 family protein [Streptomyces sp. BJ20]
MLTDLERVLPRLREHRIAGGRGIDWVSIESDLGTRLPSDFIELAEAYPRFSLDDFLSVHIPEPGGERFFTAGVRETLDELADLRDSGMSHEHVPYPEPGGLFPWGTSAEGDTFYWRMTGGHPDAWTILVSGHNDDWCAYQGTVTEYLAGLLAGTVSPDGLPPDFPREAPTLDFD